MKALSSSNLSSPFMGCSYKWLILIFMLLTGSISAQPSNNLDNIDIGIVTYGPATSMMSRFGHTAIVLVDGNGDKAFYELAAGYSDGSRFQLPWYLTPKPLIYTAQEKNRTAALHAAFEQRRSVDVRILNLSNQQKQLFAMLLADAVDPNKALFEFGLYTKNCTTRTRDLLDQVLTRQLSTEFKHSPLLMSYREHTQRSFAYNPALMLASDLLTGRPADDATNAWDEAAFPEVFGLMLDEVNIIDRDGNLQPLVKSHYPLMSDRLSKPVLNKPASMEHWFWLLGISLALLLYLTAQHYRSGYLDSRPVRIWLIINGLIGLLICHLWFVGQEPVTMWNENVLLFSPIALFLVLTKQPILRRFLSFGLLLSVMAVVVLKILPGSQNNWSWIGLIVPAHCVVLYHLLVVRNAHTANQPYKKTVSQYAYQQ